MKHNGQKLTIVHVEQ